MKIVFVGAGNLATQLALSLKEAGHEILQVYSRTIVSATALASQLNCNATDSLEQVVYDADVYIFAVKDTVLEQLAESVIPGREKALFLHTAGSMPASVFAKACHYGVFYPMQTFSKSQHVEFREIPCFIEASGQEELQRVKELAMSVSDRVYEVSTEDRRQLHLAAVFACNFVNHCYALSAEILAARNIPFDVMWPLTDETARKIHQLKPAEAQTGPALRYDRNVMDKQTALLEQHPQWKEIYECMSRSIYELAQQKGGKQNDKL